MVAIKCAWCGNTAFKAAGAVNRSLAIKAPLYCGRKCASLGRRTDKTLAQKRAEKAEYDRRYRQENLSEIKKKKAAHFQATYDPKLARVMRKLRAEEHAEYCRQPKYKAYKREYDKKRRADEYGPFADAYLTILELNREVKGRMSNEQISQENGTFNKRQNRRREAGSEENRHRSHQTVDGQ